MTYEPAPNGEAVSEIECLCSGCSESIHKSDKDKLNVNLMSVMSLFQICLFDHGVLDNDRPSQKLTEVK